MRILGLDFGSKTVGVAITDPLGMTAQGMEIVRRESPNKLRKTLSRIETIIKENDVELIVLGLPVNMDGRQKNLQICLHVEAEWRLFFRTND